MTPASASRRASRCITGTSSSSAPGGKGSPNLLELLQDVTPKCHPTDRGDCGMGSGGVESSSPLVRDADHPESAIRALAHRCPPSGPLRPRILLPDLGQQHRGQPG